MKKQLSFAILIALILSSLNLNAQEQTSFSKVNLGLGMGLDYGGFGGRLSIVPEKHFALYGSVGYAIIGVGYNVGGTIKLSPDKRFCPTLGAMYGYNAVIKIIGAEGLNQTYYGPSFSLGFELKSNNKPKNFWNIELIFPLKSEEYNDDMDAIKNSPNIELKSEPLPIAFSIGYHFGF